ncbi:MAG: hypothetical protein AB7Q17_14230 [Phycisphaerae bacterium]
MPHAEEIHALIDQIQFADDKHDAGALLLKLLALPDCPLSLATAALYATRADNSATAFDECLRSLLIGDRSLMPVGRVAVNWEYNAVAHALRRAWSRAAPDAPANRETGRTVDGTPGASKCAAALVLLVDHPDWTDARIARAAGVSRRTLYKWPKYIAARGAIEAGRHDLPSGSKINGQIDAYDDA